MTDDDHKELVRLLASARMASKTGRAADATAAIRQALRKIAPDRSIESALRGETLRPYPETVGGPRRAST